MPNLNGQGPRGRGSRKQNGRCSNNGPGNQQGCNKQQGNCNNQRMQQFNSKGNGMGMMSDLEAKVEALTNELEQLKTELH